MTGDGFLALCLVAGLAGLALAWWIATQLGPAAPLCGPGGGQLPSHAPRPASGALDVAREHALALGWARQQTTAVLVDRVRVEPSAEDVFAWAAAHRVLAERGVIPLPVREAARR